jgi:hypothetical protein
MKKTTLFTVLAFCFAIHINSQVHLDVQDNAVFNTAERIAKFSVSDASRDFLEIVNGTQYQNQFVPNIWAHRESDNRIAFNIFSSIKSNVDTGTSPIFTFRAELRNSVYDNFPYPWGSTVAQVQNRPLFSWANYNSTKMLMKANGYLGLGTTNPTAQLHTTGTLRFQNLPNATNPTYMLGTDASGNVREYPVNAGGGSDMDWLKTTGGAATSINDYIYTYGRVGVGTNAPTALFHTNGSVRFENLPNALDNPKYLLGTDTAGNVKKYRSITFELPIRELQDVVDRQRNQITLLQNQLDDLKRMIKKDFSTPKEQTSFSANYPNPFSSTTTLDYFILKDVKKAKIIIYDTSGTTVTTYQLKDRGTKSQLIINKGKLTSGIYFYTMIADNVVIGTKKMIVK